MNDSTVIQFIVIAIAAGTPLVFGSVGEILCERAGVMNLGIEGMMLLGAVIGYATVVSTREPLARRRRRAPPAGAAARLVHAVLSISLRANQIVSGIALVIVGTGLSRTWEISARPPLTNRPLTTLDLPVFTAGPPTSRSSARSCSGRTCSCTCRGRSSPRRFYLFRTRAGL